MARPRYRILTAAVCLALAACGDNGTGPEDDETRMIVDDPSFASVVQDIFDRRGCASGSCHGSAQAAGLDLRSGSSYGNLVNVTATQSAASRVIPGNAQDSYLIIKVEGRQTVGSRMPIGGAALDNIDLTNLKNWINQGAKNN
jgi:hypothetical protein